ncbi:SDR family NAD(P)-dependent oxidoreductase [Porticoccaceae bacterium]|jgi:NAD(P)-dependent dehydrogenase (short-subunit alcohol dehydrogenase family)|nr:SDR family NAD(P)-dependent oxidoreductase [Porticoccaceae bacterium]MDB2383668.1 SDR family NAD(P)-dependent oxidoreductase [Porticoccaceae bacterium]MDB2566028.1 SDR family NAD(P)-dependent oxidoreductase [Porticoccaceae bacterium]MDB2620960.1 SDR family NAD(P)-dependent oxidoreductase [Porticoccaceae bacterium]MDB2669812.1 SDR family NAD(P)-dependent oxidoreductase [Porticoccaceae bacterium]
MSQFAGKTAIISGGAEGIGLSIAKALGEQKMNIVLGDIDQKNLEKASLELRDSGISVLPVTLDVADETQWHNAAQQAIERFGKIHMVVNNAGIGGDTGPIQNAQTKGWQWALDVNLMGVMYGAKVIVPWIKQHGEGGWIINVASMAGMGGIPYNGAYTATKTAVVALSESWAAELQSKGIKVSVLCPAFVQTRIYDSDRNRPLKYQNDTATPTNEDSFADKTKHLVENGIDVSIVGKRVVEALNDGELYIFTHPNYRAIVQRRFQAIDAAFERAAQSPLLEHIANQKLDML